MFIGYVLTCQGPYLKKLKTQPLEWEKKKLQMTTNISGKWARTQKYYGKGKN